MNGLDTTLPDAAVLQKPYRLAFCRPDEAETPAAAIEAGAPVDALSVTERETAAAFRAPKRLRDWLAGRLAAKRVLGWRLQQAGRRHSPREIEVLNLPDGMPYARLPGGAVTLAGTLSISHAGGWGAAAACEPWASVGVDLETVAPRPRAFLETMAHDSEWAPWMETDPEEQTRLWTLKEAAAKLLGTGFSVGFWDIRLVLTGEARTLELHGKALERWETLGRPNIHFDTRPDEDRILTVAYAVRPEAR